MLSSSSCVEFGQSGTPAVVLTPDHGLQTRLDRYLQSAGYIVELASNPQNAAVSCRRRANRLVVVDVDAVGSGALEFCRELRESIPDRHCGILAVTACAEVSWVERLLEAGADDCLAGPFDETALGIRLNVLERHLPRRDFPPEHCGQCPIAENVTDLVWSGRFDCAVELPEDLSRDAALQIAERLFSSWQFTYTSPSVERILGYTPEEANCLHPSQILAPESHRPAQEYCAELLLEACRGSINPGRTPLEVRHVAKDGEVRWGEATMAFLHDQHGQIAGVLGITRDVTDRKRAEEAVLREQEFLRQLLDLQEQERKLLAVELHDEFAQQLTGALMTLESAARLFPQSPESANMQFDAALRLLRGSIDQSRKLVCSLSPPALDQFGIVSAIEHWISKEQTPDGPKIEFVLKGRPRRVAPPLESAIFRIVQETLSNALRHSQSERVYLELGCDAESIWIMVQDWGVGFESSRVKEGHFGLKGVRERARLFGGHAVVRTAPGEGASIHVRLPVIHPVSSWAGEFTSE